MKRKIFTSAAALVLSSLCPQLAKATVLKFTYQFADGNSFGADAEGTLGKDQNTFLVDRVDQVYGNGSAVFGNSSDILVANGHNILTLNGQGIQFQVRNLDYSVLAEIMHGTVYNPSYTVNTYGGNLPVERSQTFNPTQYSATIGGVPEPATWALTLIGFGLIGSAMRRGDRSTVCLS